MSALWIEHDGMAMMLNQWIYSHEWCEILYTTPCWSVSVCLFSHLLSHKCNDFRGPCADPLLSRSFIHSHAHTLILRQTDTVIECPRSQSLASSRCLKTGGTSVLDSPSSPLPLATFVGKRLAVKSNRKTASQPLRPRRTDTKFL